VVAIYSTFLQRAYDSIIHDVAIQKLPVIFALDRAGMVGEDGQTHMGLYDIAYMLAVPHMTVTAPKGRRRAHRAAALRPEAHRGAVFAALPARQGAGRGTARGRGARHPLRDVGAAQEREGLRDPRGRCDVQAGARGR